MAALFRVNQIAIQVANYAALPLQLILLGPFMSYGETIFLQTHTDFSTETIKHYLQEGPRAFLTKFGSLFLCGAVLWLIVAPFLVLIVYRILIKPMRRFVKQNAPI